MSRKTITLTLTLEVETGDAEILDIRLGRSAPPPMDTLIGTVPADVAAMIEEYASPSMAHLQREFAERCVSDLSLDLETPSGGRKYINAYPPKRYGAKRAAAFDVKSGRVEIYCRPENAEGRRLADIVTNNGQPFAVKVYLHSLDAVAEAIELTGAGLDERER
jgi:hypothetical protein